LASPHASQGLISARLAPLRKGGRAFGLGLSPGGGGGPCHRSLAHPPREGEGLTLEAAAWRTSPVRGRA